MTQPVAEDRRLSPDSPPCVRLPRRLLARSEAKTKVVIIDDEALVRAGLELILTGAGDIDVVCACDRTRAVAAVTENRPDVVLLDVHMPYADGLTVLAQLKESRLPSSPAVAMLTTFDTQQYVADALSLGAAGFLLKDTDPQRLPHIVHTLAEGGLVFSPMIGSKIAAGYLSGMGDPNARRIVGRLSVREVDVVRLLARGRNNAEIAKTLYIGVGTVKDHVRSILAKLSVTSRVEAAVIAQRSGILERRDQ